MTSLPCGYYGWTPGVTTPTIPYLPGPEPIRAPVQPGAVGEKWRVVIGRFPTGGTRGVLWDAKITWFSERDRALGGNRITVTAPTTPSVMRLLGDREGSERGPNGGRLYGIKNAISYELLLGSDIDGLIRYRFVVRDQVEVANGQVTINATGFIGGLTADRIIGAPEPLNLLGNGASFESGSLVRWAVHGADATAGVDAGGVDGSYAAWVQGTPGEAWIEKSYHYTSVPRPWGQVPIAGTAYVKLPEGEDIDDYGLVTIAVHDTATGAQLYPLPGRGDPNAGVVTSDMVRGSWVKNPVIGIGKLPTPPFDAYVTVRLHATSKTQRTYYDAPELIRRESSSTVNPVDITRHVTQLFRHAQEGRDKGPGWGITIYEGNPLGVSEVGTWWHDDAQSLDDALTALEGRGIEMWDLAGPGRRVASSKRRGQVRRDVQINPWDILGRTPFRVDPGAQRTAVRGVSAAGSIWGGADAGAIDTSNSNGQVIDVVLSGPVGMMPNQLKDWTRSEMAGLATLQGTGRIKVAPRLGMRLRVGDTVRLAQVDGSAVHMDWVRISERNPNFDGRYVELAYGTDPDLGGR